MRLKLKSPRADGQRGGEVQRVHTMEKKSRGRSPAARTKSTGVVGRGQRPQSSSSQCFVSVAR